MHGTHRLPRGSSPHIHANVHAHRHVAGGETFGQRLYHWGISFFPLRGLRMYTWSRARAMVSPEGEGPLANALTTHEVGDNVLSSRDSA